MVIMSNIAPRPYLVVPRLIEQPTWGGSYILETKNWTSIPHLEGKKIGQSYEVFGKSKLLTSVTDSADPCFLPEMAEASGELATEQIHSYSSAEYIEIQSLFEKPMDLLIKFTQAAGNSFQLHVVPGTKDVRWLPKPESWYYFEDGFISCGIKKDANIEDYKKVCREIETLMKLLSVQVKSKTLTFEDAQQQAQSTIHELNPWQFINVIETKKNELIDLSAGGIHHSWEEDRVRFPLGNVLYEVQVDVMDPYCTIRSFDQGKMKEDGSIREIHIDDYFKYIDTDPAHNDIAALRRTRQGDHLLKTPYYSLDVLEIADKQIENMREPFHHLFVKEGAVTVKCAEGSVHVTRGHSCLVPGSVKMYEIVAESPSVILKTYI
jgi:hypothetical protein